MKKALKIILALIVILLVLSVAALVAVRYIKNNYTVKNIIVEGNVHYTSDEIIKFVTEGDFGNNSLYLSRKYKNREIKDIPFIETINVTIESKDSIHIYVYEKALAGFMEYLGRYVYFDKDGVVVEVSSVITKGVPEVVGLKFDYVVLYEKLPAKNESVFTRVLNLTKLMTKYKVMAQKVYFKDNGETVLYEDNIIINLGTDDNLDVKIMNLPPILENLVGKSGVLKMENYNENTKRVSFEPY